jgi:RNA polymerase sigma factor (sigma-70 family)
MPGDASSSLIKQIDTLFTAGTATGWSDGQLLERFIARRDQIAEAAFAALVDRHGPMVLRVCRQVLGDEHDAQDASQATFMVLARRAASISRRESVGAWLHGVALRVAAKARLASARRRAHERRGGEMTAACELDARLDKEGDSERWRELHDELNRLPERFRIPLVLCHLEGLTQEQAAGQLRWPLGTLQSRLARGRTKLKARLTRRGLGLPFGLLDPGSSTTPLSPVSQDWAATTVRLALQFSQSSRGARTVVARAASAALAEEVLRSMILNKLGGSVVLSLFVAALVTGAVAWSKHSAEPIAAAAATKVEPPAANAPLEIVQEQPQEPPKQVKRTIRGIVRDENGRPVAKAWVGFKIEPLQDLWVDVEPRDRIRETNSPYHNEQGKIVPPGPRGRYFELRDEQGKWSAVHPEGVKDHAAHADHASPLSQFLHKLEVRVGKGRRKMDSGGLRDPALRTNLEGKFETTIPIAREAGQLHFASPDFSREAVRVVKADEPDPFIHVILRPTRLVRATLVETPQDRPDDSAAVLVYEIAREKKDAYFLPIIDEAGAFWGETRTSGSAPLAESAASTRGGKRSWSLFLPPGRYKLLFESTTLLRFKYLDVPPGTGPLDLPEVRLESLAWTKLIGKPAPDIDATDVVGRPVKLADYRGKVVLLVFWASWDGAAPEALLRGLNELKGHFKDQPLVVLGLHDASVTSVEAYQKAVTPIRQRLFNAGELPVHELLDRAPMGKGNGLYPAGSGEQGSGRTSDAFDILSRPSLFVIGKEGTLVAAFVANGTIPQNPQTFVSGGAFTDVDEFRWTDLGQPGRSNERYSFDALKGSLEDLLGLPRVHHARPFGDPASGEPPGEEPVPSTRPLVIKGKVVDRDERPIVGATVTGGHSNRFREKHVASDPMGKFALTLNEVFPNFELRVEAKGCASRGFAFRFGSELRSPYGDRVILAVDPSGVIPKPLRMGPGAAVSGRVVRDRRPIPHVRVVLERSEDEDADSFPLETHTDEHGIFRFPNLWPNAELWASIGLGHLTDNGAMTPRLFRSGEEGSSLDLGDLEVHGGFTLAGRLVCSGGRPLPPKTEAKVAVEHVPGSLLLHPDEKGWFQANGLPPGLATVRLESSGRDAPQATRHRLSSKNMCLNPRFPNRLEGQIRENIKDLTILLEPGRERLTLDHSLAIDPAVMADFEDAKAGPITGVPPESFKRK